MQSTLVVKTAAKNAELVRRAIADAGVLRGDLVPLREADFVLFPVTRKIALPAGVKHSCSFERSSKLEARTRPGDFKELLAAFLTNAELAAAIKSFDVVGVIAVIQVPAKLNGKAKRIARALLASHPRVKTVLQKTGGRTGAFRVQRVRWLAGAKTFATLHRENNCLFKVNLKTAYYSPRLSTERERIAGLVKPNEKVLVPFAGVGPFAIPIARLQPSAEVVGIELNPAAARLFKENVALNKMDGRVRAVRGDALKAMASPEFRAWADRIVMPLPHSARSFLPAALKALKRGGTIHFYRIVDKTLGEKELEREAREACAAAEPKRKFRRIASRHVINYSPRLAEFVLDFKAS